MAKSKKKNQKVSIVITKDMLIALLVIVLIAAIALAVLYFAFPDTWDALVVLVVGPQDEGPNSNDSNGKPEDTGIPIVKGDVNIYFIDVGQGDSILTILPDGKTILIDGGDRPTEAANAVTTTLSKLKIKTLNYVILTHTDSDHCGSLDNAIKSVTNVEQVYVPKVQTKNKLLPLDNTFQTKATAVYDDFIKAAQDCTYEAPDGTRKSTEILFLQDLIVLTDAEIGVTDATYSYKFAMFCRDDAYYKSMNTSDAHDLNDVSPICVLSANNRLVVYTGDANYSKDPTSSEAHFMQAMKNLGYQDNDEHDDFDADILKVAHHGSAGSTGADFLEYVDCEYAVISSGGDVHYDGPTIEPEDRRYDLYLSQEYDNKNINIIDFQGNDKHDHPHGDVCKDGGRLEQGGIIECYYTVLHGTIHCNINTQGNITFETENVPVIEGNTVTFRPALAA